MNISKGKKVHRMQDTSSRCNLSEESHNDTFNSASNNILQYIRSVTGQATQLSLNVHEPCWSIQHTWTIIIKHYTLNIQQIFTFLEPRKFRVKATAGSGSG